MIPPWFQACIYWKSISLKAIRFLYGSIIMSREYLKRSMCWGHCAYFATLFAVIQYNNWSVVDTIKIERCAYLKKVIVAKVPIYSAELVAVIFVCESICSHSILIWQFHNSNCSYLLIIVNFFRRAIVHICTCKGDLGNSCFLQRAALSKYL